MSYCTEYVIAASGSLEAAGVFFLSIKTIHLH